MRSGKGSLLGRNRFGQFPRCPNCIRLEEGLRFLTGIVSTLESGGSVRGMNKVAMTLHFYIDKFIEGKDWQDVCGQERE